ncbi:MAG: hypothetical protein ACRD33_01155 [Candidatus Acidiferrales bacterium]
MKAELAKPPVRGKAISIKKNPRAAQADADIPGLLQKQRQAAEFEAAQMKVAARGQGQAGMLGGTSQPMAANGNRATLPTRVATTGAQSPTNKAAVAPSAKIQKAPTVATTEPSQTLNAPGNASGTLLRKSSGAQSANNNGSSGNSNTGAGSPANKYSSMASISYLPNSNATVLLCAQDPTMRILHVSGSSSPATFTPIDEYNLYTITGCSFGNQAPTNDASPTDWVHIYGGTGSFYGKFAIKFWSDNEIEVSLDESLSGFPDLNNLNLVVKRADGRQTQKGGFKFYAARQTVPLTTIPQSWVKLAPFPTDWSIAYSTPPASGFVYPKPAIPAPGASAGSAYLSRSSDGHKFDIDLPYYDYYDFSRLAPGWTTDSFEVDPFEANCPAGAGWTLTYKQSFGAWSGQWDGNNIRVGLSDTSCSGFIAPAPFIGNYQNWTGSYYALTVWVTGPRGIDPLTDQPTKP